MSHLNEVGLNYFQHLFRSLRWAFILIIHGIFPNIWKDKASGEICVDRQVSNATRDYLLRKMYKIDPKRTPSIYERLSDRELVARTLFDRKDSKNS